MNWRWFFVGAKNKNTDKPKQTISERLQELEKRTKDLSDTATEITKVHKRSVFQDAADPFKRVMHTNDSVE